MLIKLNNNKIIYVGIPIFIQELQYYYKYQENHSIQTL